MKVTTALLILGVLIIIGFFGSLILMLWRPDTITTVNREPVMLMVGCLISAFSLLIGFYYGSSIGFAIKNTWTRPSADPIVDLTKPV